MYKRQVLSGSLCDYLSLALSPFLFLFGVLYFSPFRDSLFLSFRLSHSLSPSLFFLCLTLSTTFPVCLPFFSLLSSQHFYPPLSVYLSLNICDMFTLSLPHSVRNHCPFLFSIPLTLYLSISPLLSFYYISHALSVYCLLYTSRCV